jgi:hypothetical protein
LISAPPVIGNCCLALLHNAALHEAGIGPSRRFDAALQFGRFLSEADMNKIYEYAPSPA